MKKTNWTLFVPIYNLNIAREIGGEITIEDVHFISSSKIPYVRRKLKIKNRISTYREYLLNRDIKPLPFEEAKVYACLRTSRVEKDKLDREFSLIRDAVYILASSQYFIQPRDMKRAFGGPEFKSNIIDSYFLFTVVSHFLSARDRISKSSLVEKSPVL